MSMGFKDARHLLSRCGFGGADLRVMMRFAEYNREEAVMKLLDATDDGFQQYLTQWKPNQAPSLKEMKLMSVEERVNGRNLRVNKKHEFVTHWIQNLYQTKAILHEKMVLFWHNYICTSLISEPELNSFYHLNQIVRNEALGSFERMTYGLFANGSFLRRFHNTNNYKGHPDYRFADNILSKIYLGPDRYSRQDRKGLTLAMTGAGIDPETRKYTFNRSIHDDSVKVIFGVPAKYEPQDIPGLLLSNTQSSTRVIEYLWMQFISPNPDPDEVKLLTAVFRRSGFNIKTVLETLLMSDSFWSFQNRGQLVKSPLELMISSFHLLGYKNIDVKYTLSAASHAGEVLFRNNNSMGWPNTSGWVNQEIWKNRKTFTQRLARGRETSYTPFPPSKLNLTFLSENGMADEDILALTLPPTPFKPDLGHFFEDKDRVRAILSNAAYQLK